MNSEFFKQIDIHALSSVESIQKASAITVEHGFRGLVVNEFSLKSARAFHKKSKEDYKLIVALDYNSGEMSTGARCNMIDDVIRNGANEIEISIQSKSFIDMDFKIIEEDVSKIGKISRDTNIDIKYKIDPSLPNTTPQNIANVCRILHKSGIKYVTNNIASCDKIDHSETAIFLRDVCKGSACHTKAYIQSPAIDVFLMFKKAGINIIGLDLKNAVRISYDALQETV